MEVRSGNVCEKMLCALTKSNCTPSEPNEKSSIVREGRSLHAQDLGPELIGDPLVDEPRVRLDAVVVARPQIGNEEAPGAQRAATKVEQPMGLTEPGLEEERELQAADQVVLAGRADERAVRRPVLGSDPAPDGVFVS